MNSNWQNHSQSESQVNGSDAAFNRQPELKLNLETRNLGDVTIVHCQGRIVYRDEAAALSSLVAQDLQHNGKLILDLSGVSSIDSAGIGELVLLHTWAQRENVALKCAGANSLVRNLLDLTHLDSVLELHSSLENAVESFSSDEVCANC